MEETTKLSVNHSIRDRRHRLHSSESMPISNYRTYGAIKFPPPVNPDSPNSGTNSKDDILLRPSISLDQFGDIQLTHINDTRAFNNKVTRTGRQRKKLAARTKGGEFETKKKKRRVNFCCICSEIDLEALHDELFDLQVQGGDESGYIWETKMYEDVLHIFQTKRSEKKIPSNQKDVKKNENNNDDDDDQYDNDDLVPIRLTRASSLSTSQALHPFRGAYETIQADSDGYESASQLMESTHSNISPMSYNMMQQQIKDRINSNKHEFVMDSLHDMSLTLNDVKDKQSTAVLWSTGGREAFIFEFGAVVFWGFPKGEEDELIKLIRKYIEQGEIAEDEFDEGRDDMAFITSSLPTITIANDVISLPDESTAKCRMSVSFAIAQSAVLNIFEARVELKVKEFKHIPETLASNKGKIFQS